MNEITNEDLAKAIEAQAGRFEEHAIADHAFQQEQIAVNKEILAGQEEIKEFMKNVHVGLGFFKFTFNNTEKIGAFLIFIFAIYIFLKLGLIGVINWARSIGAL